MYLEAINLLQCIYLFLCVFGLILAGYLPRFNALGLLLALQALQMAGNLLEETRSISYLLTPALTLGYGPALYLFCQQLVYNRLAPGFWRHFVPVVLSIPLTSWPQGVIALGSLSQLIYIVAAMRLLNRYQLVAWQVRADAANLSLRWMLCLLAAFLFMMLQDALRLNLQPYTPYDLRQSWYFANTLLYFLLTAFLIVMAVRQPQLFNDFREFADLVSPANHVEKPATDPTAAALFAQLDELIRSRELFKQMRFSLRDLADASGLHEKQLSGIINQGAGRNFCDYINQLRIEAICRELSLGNSGSLLDLALAMGFGAKSTFNTAFKKETGMTPSQFVQQRQNKVQDHDSGRSGTR